jgi:hypothetical protein
MNTLPDMSDIMGFMHEFQSKNNIKKQCITNAKFLYDSIQHSNWGFNKANPKAVIVVYNIPDKNEIIYAVHMVVQYKNKLLEPSYEYGHLKNTQYYDNINNVIKQMKLINPEFNREFVAGLISTYLEFVKYAEQIQAGKFLVDRKYYDLQADYIEEKIRCAIERPAQNQPAQNLLKPFCI